MNPTVLNEALTGRYSVEREIGHGGMATVYLARDLRHDRLVAVKVLNAELGAVLGVERFLSEIRVTANLQHPNLLPLFDSGEANGLLFYVMPYVEGETLRHRLEREKQLPIDDAVRFALAIANALEYAHAHGVIHRDLKPENILLQHGEAVVADFGIALAVSNAGGQRITQTGLSLGTPQYMSPEQASGDRVIDGRADIYSLAAMLYEMIGGEPPHTGTSGQAIIAKLMTEEPRPLSSLRRLAPPHVGAAVHRGLEKLPSDRWSSAREFAEAVRGERGVSAVRFSRPRSALTWALGGVALVATIVAVIEAIAASRASPPLMTTLRFPFVTSDSERFLPVTPAIPFSISPDDRRVVYVGAGPRLYVRGLDDMQTRALPNTESPLQPNFSPDGKWIAAVIGNRIVKTPVDGGALTTVRSLAGTSNAGVVWDKPDTIIASVGGSLEAIPTDGGTPVVISTPDTAHGEKQQWGPRSIGSRFVAYVSIGTTGMWSNRIGILDRQTRRSRVTSLYGTTILGAIDDRLIWVTAGGDVMAAKVDGHGELGPEQLVLEDVLVRPGGAAKATLSRSGSLLYQRGASLSELVVVDEQGVATPLGVEPHAFNHPRWSPDGSHIAVAIARAGGADIWLIDTRTKALSKLTNGTGSDGQPTWTADSKRVVYRSIETKGTWLKVMAIDGSEQPRVLVAVGLDAYSGGISGDGKWIYYRTGDVTRSFRDIFAAPLDGSGTRMTIREGPASDVNPTLSPDSHVLGYSSDASGLLEAYLQPFPGSGQALQVSRLGGTEPVWSKDGRTFFYRAGRAIHAVTVSSSPLSLSNDRVMFEGNFMSDPGFTDYDVAPDGKHFLMLSSVDRQAETIMVYRWADELRKRWR